MHMHTNTRNENKVALITGASHGIGLALTRRLLSEGWQVAVLVRSAMPEADSLIRDSLRTGRLRVYQAELTDFASIRQAVDRIRAAETKLDVLFNNAGGSFPELRYSKQGRELHYELHAVTPYILVMELKDLLTHGAHRIVVNTSSSVVKMVKHLSLAELERPASFRMLFGPYAASKLAMSLWTQEAAAVLAQEGIVIRSADPGGNNTLRPGQPSGLPFFVKPLMKLLFPRPERGASLLYDAAFGDHGGKSGIFLLKNRETPLKFAEQGMAVLAGIQQIYETEYAGQPA
jgi:NAD(P)-dependent dehydrogenase (short-subunit alcohol dehydrogenase family)